MIFFKYFSVPPRDLRPWFQYKVNGESWIVPGGRGFQTMTHCVLSLLLRHCVFVSADLHCLMVLLFGNCFCTHFMKVNTAFDIINKLQEVLIYSDFRAAKDHRHNSPK